MPRIVVLGTGTSVGKTHVTVALARALSRSDSLASVGAVKPIESGSGSDAHALRDASSSRSPAVHPLYNFSEPLTPYLAALRSRATPVMVSKVVAWLDEWEDHLAVALSCPRHWTLVETAGGVFSPLAPAVTNYDLARALEPAIWVLVAADALGTLHAITATCEALRARGRSPDYLVLSAARAADFSTGTNAQVLADLAIFQPIAVLGPKQTDLSALAQVLVARETEV